MTLTANQLKRRLFYYGHFHSPNTDPSLHLWDKAETDGLTMYDPQVTAAVASYQDFMGVDFERLAMNAHGRSGIADGEVGPATNELLELPRCGRPDFANPMEASGSGSWPMPCQKDGIGVSYQYNTMPDHLEDRWDRIKKRVFEAYHDIGANVVEVDYQHATDHEHIRVKWKSLAGSTIGLAEFNSRSCSDSVFHYLDPNFMREDDDSLMELHLHEFGHNMNLQHVRQGSGVMSPAIRRGRSFEGWVPRDPSYSVLKRYFGGDPIDVEPDPPVDPTPTPSISGTILIGGRPYILVPEGGTGPRPRV